MNSVEQIKEATKRRVNGLFFIKTKHAKPRYNNHHYFQIKGANQCRQSIDTNKTHQNSSRKTQWGMFVNQPSGYGIDNTLKYLIQTANSPSSQTQSYKALDITLKKDKIKLKDILKKNKKEEGSERRRSDKSEKSPKNMAKVEQCGDESPIKKLEEEKSQVWDNREVQSMKRGKRIQTEPEFTQYEKQFNAKELQSYHKMTQSVFHRFKSNADHKLKAAMVASGPKISRDSIRTEHKIELIYISSSEDYYAAANSSLSARIHVDILPYLVGTFLKCKIHYFQKNTNNVPALSQQKYNRILRYIRETLKHLLESPNNPDFDIKNIVNISSFEQLEQMLQIYGQGSNQWYETIRHFFIPKDDKVYDHQFMKLIDEIKLMSVLKNNIDVGSSNVTIFRVRDRVKMVGLQDFLLFSPTSTEQSQCLSNTQEELFIFGQGKSVLETYNSIMKRNSQMESYKERIKRWRSVAPLQEESVAENTSSYYQSFMKSKIPPSNHHNVRLRSINKTTINGSLQSRVKTCEDCSIDSTYPRKTLHSGMKIAKKEHSFDRYDHLYQASREKHERGMRGRDMSHNFNSRVSGNKNNYSAFIDKTKLNKSYDIFE